LDRLNKVDKWFARQKGVYNNKSHHFKPQIH